MAFTGWETHTRQSNVRDQQKGQAKICLLPTQSSPLLEMEVEVEVELEIKCSNDNRGLGWWEDRRTAERSGAEWPGAAGQITSIGIGYT